MKHEKSFHTLVSPFEVDAEAVPKRFQVKLTDIKSNEEKVLNASLLEFYKPYVLQNNIPQLQTCDTVLNSCLEVPLFMSNYFKK